MGLDPGTFAETQLILTTHDLLKAHDAGKRIDLAVLDFFQSI